MSVNSKWLSDRTESLGGTLWTKQLNITQLAQSTLPVGSPRVNLIDKAKHVEPIAECWRTGVQIPPAPPNKPSKIKHLRFYNTQKWYLFRVVLTPFGQQCFTRKKPLNWGFFTLLTAQILHAHDFDKFVNHLAQSTQPINPWYNHLRLHFRLANLEYALPLNQAHPTSN